MRQKQTTNTKRPAAQVEPRRRRLKLKAENAAKRPQPHWLQRPLPVLERSAPAPERVNAANQSQGRRDCSARPRSAPSPASRSPPSGRWMRAGTFPRSRVVGGKSDVAVDRN